MNASEKIVEAALAGVRGEISLPRALPGGWCLRMTRVVIEKAFGWQDGELYWRYPAKLSTKTPEPRNYWARDIQASFRAAGYGVSTFDAMPGDVICHWRAAKNQYGDYVGHVGILVPFAGGEMRLLENIHPTHRESFGAFANGALSLTPWERWKEGREVECFRLPEP